MASYRFLPTPFPRLSVSLRVQWKQKTNITPHPQTVLYTPLLDPRETDPCCSFQVCDWRLQQTSFLHLWWFQLPSWHAFSHSRESILIDIYVCSFELNNNGTAPNEVFILTQCCKIVLWSIFFIFVKLLVILNNTDNRKSFQGKLFDLLHSITFKH